MVLRGADSAVFACGPWYCDGATYLLRPQGEAGTDSKQQELSRNEVLSPHNRFEF